MGFVNNSGIVATSPITERGRRVKRNKNMILTEGNKGKKGFLKIISIRKFENYLSVVPSFSSLASVKYVRG